LTAGNGIPNLPILAPVSLPGILEILVKPPDSDPEKNTLNIRPDCRNSGGNAITRWPPKHLKGLTIPPHSIGQLKRERPIKQGYHILLFPTTFIRKKPRQTKRKATEQTE